MDFGALPPEVNSGRMYSGAGPGPMLAAAAAWEGLAAELHSAAASYGVVLSDLSGGWHGPSSESMSAATVPYAEWISVTARQAEQAATQATAAAAAYESAFAAHVPPPVIAANRSLLLMLIATNLLGQNTPGIAATEAHYAEMWAQDAGAMYGYAGSAVRAVQLVPFVQPPTTADPASSQPLGAAAQSVTSTSANISQQLSQVLSAVPNGLQSLASAAAAAPVVVTDASSGLGGISSILGTLGGAYSPFGTMANVGTGWLSAMQILAFTGNVPGVLSMLGGAPPITGALGPLSGGYISWQAPVGVGSLGGVSTVSSVSALSGQASMVGSLSVPTSWTSTAPMVKTLSMSSSLPVGSIAAPALAVDGSTGMFSETALSSLVGRAVGGGAVRTFAGSSARVLDKAPDTEALTTATILVIPVGEE